MTSDVVDVMLRAARTLIKKHTSVDPDTATINFGFPAPIARRRALIRTVTATSQDTETFHPARRKEKGPSHLSFYERLGRGSIDPTITTNTETIHPASEGDL